MNKVERVIIRKLIKNQYAMEKSLLVDGIHEPHSKIVNALNHLREFGYIVLDLTSSNCLVTIPAYMRNDAFKNVYPGSPIQSELPIEEQIPNEYNKSPIFTAKGEKEIHGGVSEYWFCEKNDQPDYVTCFIFNRGRLVYRIHLGSLSNFGSLISQALRQIDDIFEKRIFKKSELVHKLPPHMVGNRQPIKAITEYLCHEKFLVRLSGSNFQRTGKIHKVDTLDEINYYRTLEQPASINLNGQKYFYTEEEGLYAKFE